MLMSFLPRGSFAAGWTGYAPLDVDAVGSIFHDRPVSPGLIDRTPLNIPGDDHHMRAPG